MNKKIAVLPGDGIGPEVTEQSIKVLKVIQEISDISFDLEYGLIGADAIEKTGEPYPAETQNICEQSDAILFGAIGDPKYDNDPGAKVRPEQGLLQMRKVLGLYTNVRPVKSYPALYEFSPLKKEKIEGVDFTVYRELTGGIYFGEPRGRNEQGTKAYDTSIYSDEEILRVTRLAVKDALKRKKKLTLVDKANVLATSRLWREKVSEYVSNYPELQYETMFVDNAAMQIIQNPASFDVILTENMFGDIITDESSVITGSIGMLPSASLGERVGLFEPIHGSYPQAAGLNIANPFASILSLAMLLDHSFAMKLESKTIIDAVNQAVNNGFLTKDLSAKGAYRSTSEVGDYVCNTYRYLFAFSTK